MKTKKTLAALTAVMMCMSMAACGNTETKSSDPNDITASEAEERLKALDSMSDEEIDELFNGENETTTTTAATTTTTTTTTTAAPAVDPDIPYAYYDDLAEEYEKCGDTSFYNITTFVGTKAISYTDNSSIKLCSNNDRLLIYYMNDKNTSSYIYTFGDKESKKVEKNGFPIHFISGDYAYNYDNSYFYRYDKDMKEVGKFKKKAGTNESSYTNHDIYYGHPESVYGINNNSIFFLGFNEDEKGQYDFHYLDGDFKTFKDIPPAETDTGHGFTEEIKMESSLSDYYVMYNNKIYNPKYGIYFSIDDMKWEQFDNSGLIGEHDANINRVIGKYIISDTSIYDMEKDVYVTKNLSKQTGSYYGGDSNIVVKGDKVYKTYVPVNPINVEGRPDELIMSGWDDKSCKILNYKYYLFKDEYGIFLREYGKDTDGEVTLIRF